MARPMTRMQRATVRVLIRHPFFATLLMGMPLIESRDVPTMATNMKWIKYNPDFVDTLEDHDVDFILVHEVCHVAFYDMDFMLGRNPTIANIAADYVNNNMLVDCGLKPPSDKAGGLFSEKYKGWSRYQVYDDLIKEAEQARKRGRPEPGEEGSGTESPMLGDMDPAELGEMSQAERTVLRREVQQRVAQAANIARLQGKLPGELERLVNELLDPKVPWTALLRDYMTRITKDDESWSRRNRRFSSIYLPARYSEKMGEIVIIGDTSGSIGNDELARYVAEIGVIAEDVRPERIRILWADTRVAGEQLFEEGEWDAKAIKPCGGGGTDMVAALKYAEQYEPEICVLLTDGYTPWPEVEPSFALISCITTEAACPVGQVVRI